MQNSGIPTVICKPPAVQGRYYVSAIHFKYFKLTHCYQQKPG